MSKQTFSKARQHIKSEAFKELLQLTSKSYLNLNQIKRLNGYRIFSIDANNLKLNLQKEIGAQPQLIELDVQSCAKFLMEY